jgi:hypothetical protein
MISMKTRSGRSHIPCGKVEVLRLDRPTRTGSKLKGSGAKEGTTCVQTDNNLERTLRKSPQASAPEDELSRGAQT